MTCATAVSSCADAAVAVREVVAALEGALGGRPTWVLLSHAVGVDAVAVQRAWAEHAPGVPAHRLTSCRSVMGDFGLTREPALGAFAVRDEGGAYGAAAESFDTDIGEPTARAIHRAMIAADRAGEAPDLVFVTTVPGTEEAVLAAIACELGTDIPVAGGTAADDALAGHWSIGDAHSTHTNGVVISVLYPSRAPTLAFSSGYVPAGVGGIVTAAEGRRIDRIDGKPAAEVYNGWTEGTVSEAIAAGGAKVLATTGLRPIGRLVDRTVGEREYVLSHPEEVHADGALSFFSQFSVGDRIELMHGTIASLITRAPRVVDGVLEGGSGRVAGALVVYCAGCMLTVGDRMSEVPAQIGAALNAPFLGVFTFGEQGRLGAAANRHGNLMISVVAFHG